MKAKLSKLITCIFCLLPVSAIFAQVTIGSTTAPEKGALLQLKDNGTYSNGETAEKGLGLPRVNLLSTKLDATTYTDLSKTIDGANGIWDKDTHIGLLIYNVNEDMCKSIGKGLYVWDGLEWQYLYEKEEVKDVRTITDNGTNQITLSYKDETTTYHYSSFGDAGIWMTENLATKYLPDGTIITRNVTNSNSDPHYLTPNNIPDNDPLINSNNKHGLLYNWPAAMAEALCATINQAQLTVGTIPGDDEVENYDNPAALGTSPNKHIQGICPEGWHLPSDREWNELEKAITEGANTYSTATYSTTETTWNTNWDITKSFRGAIQGKVMKSSNSITTTNPNGTSKSSSTGGFDILLAGYGGNGSTINYGMNATLWTSSSFNAAGAWMRSLNNTATTVNRTVLGIGNLASVRCKKN